MLAKITKRLVDGLPAGGMVWDTGLKGFGVRRQREGAFYCLRYRLNSLQYYRSIGRHGSPWTADEAREKAKRMLGEVAGGKHPANETAKLRDAETFGHEIERYLSRRKPGMKPRSFEEIERHLTAHAKPLHRARLPEIDRRTIALRLAEIETYSGPVARNRVRSSLSAFFSWCVKEGLIEANPVAGTAKADEGGSRERVLTEAELRSIWRALGDDDYGTIVRLLVLTAQRREEIGGLRWSEIDLDAGLIVLPPERTKNRREHSLPMSPQVRAILSARPRNGREFVFGIGKGSFSGWSDAKAALDERCGVEGFRTHDIRRSVATGMADKLGVLPHIIEAILNHVSGHKASVAGIYNRAQYLEPMRAALCAWADYIDRLAVRSQ
jgi:integrase